MADWIALAIATYVGLLPIVNPFSTAVVFLSLTGRFDEERKQQQAKLACLWAWGLLSAFTVAGTLIMSFFAISLPAVRFAGGLIVARMGFSMLASEPEPKVSDESHREAMSMEDISFTPLAMPMMSGPGSIAVVIGMAANSDEWWQNSAIVAGVTLVALTCWLVLRAAKRVVGFLGVTGINAMGRIMGFLLVCVGVQLVGAAVIEIVTDPRFVQAILDAAAERSPASR